LKKLKFILMATDIRIMLETKQSSAYGAGSEFSHTEHHNNKMTQRLESTLGTPSQHTSPY
jgi:hypothetical protein